MRTLAEPRLNNTEAFHQAKWNEPIIFEQTCPGERGVIPAQAEPEVVIAVGDGISRLPESIRRKSPPKLPEMAQMRVIRHYLRLSQENLGAELNVDVGQGTCTMKYSPKVNEQIVGSSKFAELHPLQDASTVQGTLEIIHKTDLFLCEVSGMDGFTFQPRSGTQGILAIASMIRAYHESRDDFERNEIVTTIFSHPSDAAAAHVLGFKIITLHPGADGLVRAAQVREVVGPKTAGLLITNPEDTGIFNPEIRQITAAVREAGGLCGYDQANANGLLGITRAREAGFDMCFFNLHKTFSVPHACGGPAVGAVGVTKELLQFLPSPVIELKDGKYHLKHDVGRSVGKIASFYGTVPGVIRAYAWIMSLGERGLREVARVAVLNNNYLLAKVLKIRGVSAPYAEGKRRIEQVRYSWEQLYRDTGVSTEDITNRMCDHGMHMWSSHHPFIVPQPMTLEPTESYSKAELDQYVAALQSISNEAYENPEIVKTAPHRSTVHKIPHDSFDDPKKWAITWRAYLKKHGAESM
jgi:glycine dehydrogenase subunit 2